MGNTAGHVRQPSPGRISAGAHVTDSWPAGRGGTHLAPLPRVPRRQRCWSAPAPGRRSPSAGPGASGRPAPTAPPAREAGRRGGPGRVRTPDVAWLFYPTPDPKLLLDTAGGSDPDPVVTSAPGLTWEGSWGGAGSAGSWATYRRAQPKPTAPRWRALRAWPPGRRRRWQGGSTKLWGWVGCGQPAAPALPPRPAHSRQGWGPLRRRRLRICVLCCPKEEAVPT